MGRTASVMRGAAPFRLDESIELQAWQQQAVDAWATAERPFQGTLEVFTGGGKTLIALSAFERVSRDDPAAKLAVVVPTEALARQWRATLERLGSFPADAIGLMGAGGKDTFAGKRALVAVLNSAAKKLPDAAPGEESVMLVVDECHRAGAPTYSKVLDTRARYRLGLSATPERDEVDEDGAPVAFDDQVVAQKLGPRVFTFGLRDAREAGWLPKYEVFHHAVELTAEERQKYESVSSEVSDFADKLQSVGVEERAAWKVARATGDKGDLARRYVAATAKRKDLLYRVSERSRVSAQLVRERVADAPDRKILLFHERVKEAVALHAKLLEECPEASLALEHSALTDREREQALRRFRSGDATVLVSVKSLVEGIDVPDAEIGVSVASSSSVRQRIQTLGRVLRRRFDGGEKRAEMHVLYVKDTVDESIYGKEDWSDLTGTDANRFYHWALEAKDPERQDGPPRTPRPTEDAIWAGWGEGLPKLPVRWDGMLPDTEYRVDTKGNVSSVRGRAPVENPQGVASMVDRVKGREGSGGRFRVTPRHRLVIVFGVAAGDDRPVPYVAGQLGEALRLGAPTVESHPPGGAGSEAPTKGPRAERASSSSLPPSAAIVPDKSKGEYKLRQKAGGVIERRRGRTTEFASVDDDAGERGENARRVLTSWRETKLPGLTFFVSNDDEAWYMHGGEVRILAKVPGGFAFPGDDGDG